MRIEYLFFHNLENRLLLSTCTLHLKCLNFILEDVSLAMTASSSNIHSSNLQIELTGVEPCLLAKPFTDLLLASNIR